MAAERLSGLSSVALEALKVDLVSVGDIVSLLVPSNCRFFVNLMGGVVVSLFGSGQFWAKRFLMALKLKANLGADELVEGADGGSLVEGISVERLEDDEQALDSSFVVRFC